MANSLDPDLTVCSEPALFASILNSSGNVRQLFAAKDFSRRNFMMHFFLGALRVNCRLLMCTFNQFGDVSIWGYLKAEPEVIRCGEFRFVISEFNKTPRISE